MTHVLADHAYFCHIGEHQQVASGAAASDPAISSPRYASRRWALYAAQPVFIFSEAERIGTNRQRVLAPMCLIQIPAPLS